MANSSGHKELQGDEIGRKEKAPENWKDAFKDFEVHEQFPPSMPLSTSLFKGCWAIQPSQNYLHCYSQQHTVFFFKLEEARKEYMLCRQIAFWLFWQVATNFGVGFWENFIVEKQFQSVKFNMKTKMENNNQIRVFVEPELYL